MSQENVERFLDAVEAYNRRDIKAMLDFHDPDVEWHPVLQVLLGGEETVYWGHSGVREFLADLDETFAQIRIEITESHDLGDLVLATGRLVGRGKESGAETEAPITYLVDVERGKATRVRTYLDPKEALEAAGLSE